MSTLKESIAQKISRYFGRNIYIPYVGSYALVAARAAISDMSVEREISVYDERSDVSDILLNADTIGMFSTDKIVVLQSFVKPLSDRTKKLLKEFAETHDESVTLIVFEDTSGKKPLSFLATGAEKIDLATHSPEMVTSEIRSILSERGVTISADNAQKIFVKCQRQLDLVANETRKLAFYLTEGSTVTERDIAECVMDTAERKTYEVADLLAKGDVRRGVNALQYFKVNSVAPTVVLSSFAAQYRRLFYTALTKKTDDQLAALFGVKPYAVKMGRPIASSYTQMTLKKLLNGMYDAEHDFKSGVCSDDSALDRVVGDLIVASGKKGR